MITDHVALTQSAADGIGLALDQDFNKVESLERMAWIVLLLKRVEDKDEFFPMGKWTTIQSIEQQLDNAVHQLFSQEGEW